MAMQVSYSIQIYGELRKDIGQILRALCEHKGVELIEGHLMPDHVHMLVSIPPRISVASFMGYLKGKSALMVFDRHSNLKYKFGNRHFWADGYYVSTVGLNTETVRKYIREQEMADMNTETVRKYIREQEMADIAHDKVTGERRDPFEG